jgi:2-polyprenyl-3-methyl-5-hydroxy-6-metoxy-1,4-benzoquinol methylase
MSTNSSDLILTSNRQCPLCCSDKCAQILTDQKINLDAINRHSFSSRKTPEFMHYRMVVCAECDLAYASPAPESSWIRNNYTNAAFDTVAVSSQAALNHAKLLDSLLPRLPNRRTALDIGAGNGAFLCELAKRGFEDVSGIEPSSAPIEMAHESVQKNISHGFFDGASHEAGSLSLITCFQVLEHVEDIAKLARSAFSLLEPGGIFLTVAHNYRALSNRLLKGRSPIFDIEHLQLFSELSLKHMYRVGGFSNCVVNSMVNSYELAYWLKLAPLPQLLKHPLSSFIKRLKLHNVQISLRAGNLWAWGTKHN